MAARIVSLPSRERGLKYLLALYARHRRVSLPSRERGLKFFPPALAGARRGSLPSRERGLKFFCGMNTAPAEHVAPFAGAWIEISLLDKAPLANASLPSRERGLKFIGVSYIDDVAVSLPSRERGLKFDEQTGFLGVLDVALFAGSAD